MTGETKRPRDERDRELLTLAYAGALESGDDDVVDAILRVAEVDALLEHALAEVEAGLFDEVTGGMSDAEIDARVLAALRQNSDRGASEEDRETRPALQEVTATELSSANSTSSPDQRTLTDLASSAAPAIPTLREALQAVREGIPSGTPLRREVDAAIAQLQNDLPLPEQATRQRIASLMERAGLTVTEALQRLVSERAKKLSLQRQWTLAAARRQRPPQRPETTESAPPPGEES